MLEAITRLWKDRVAVAAYIENVAWGCGFEGDHDDQVRIARQLGVVCGASQTPQGAIDGARVLFDAWGVTLP